MLSFACKDAECSLTEGDYSVAVGGKTLSRKVCRVISYWCTVCNFIENACSNNKDVAVAADSCDCFVKGVDFVNFAVEKTVKGLVSSEINSAFCSMDFVNLSAGE